MSFDFFDAAMLTGETAPLVLTPPITQEVSLLSAAQIEGDEYLAAGDYERFGEPQPDPDDDIVVTAKRLPKVEDEGVWLRLISRASSPDDDNFPKIGDDPVPGFGALSDEDAIDVELNFDRPLTESEKQALAAFLKAIESYTAIINSLSDTASIVLPGGEVVTGAELKATWAKMDFRIDSNATYSQFGGGTHDRGGVTWNAGDATIFANIEFLDDQTNTGYSRDAFMNWFIGHELGHTTSGARGLIDTGWNEARDQRLANDLARFLGELGRLPLLADPRFGYTPGASYVFDFADWDWDPVNPGGY